MEEHSYLLINCLRLDAMITFMTSMQSNYLKRTLINNYQFRDTDVWNDEERAEAETLFNSIGAGKKLSRSDAFDVEDLFSTKYFSSKDINDQTSEIKFGNLQMNSVATIFASTVEPSLPTTKHASDAFHSSGSGHNSSLSQYGLREILRV
jgi:hypothetical protein